MEYTITIFKKQGELLYAIWIDVLNADPQPGIVWQVVQTVKVTTEIPIPSALCSLLLMSEATSDKLFRNTVDTWIGPVEDDPLDDYAKISSVEETSYSLDKAYSDRVDDGA